MVRHQGSQLILDRYRVVKAAGSGGFATVLHAYDTKLGRDVAIKRIQLSESDVARARLLAMEARMGSAFADYESEGEDEGLPGREYAGLGRAGHEAAGRESASPTPARDDSAVRKTPSHASDFDLEFDLDESDFPEDPSFLDVFHPAEKAARGKHAGTQLLSGARSSVPSDIRSAASSSADDRSASSAGAHSASASPAHLSEPLDDELLDDEDPFDHIPGLQEARMVAKISDDNIVHVYECELHENTAYIIMEYVEGKTLTQVLEEAGDSLTLDAVAAVFSSVAHALEVAHGSEILHLDIKPDNVMINQKGVVKVTDFGLATLVDATGHGAAGAGTIGYMPLEQMRQEPLDAHADQWSLAAMTYEMLSGSNPFFADTLVEAEEAIEEAELVLPSLCWDDMDQGIDDVMFTALDLEPGDRYPSVADFAEALLPYLGSPKKGKKELAKLVRGEVEEVAPEPPAPKKPAVPLMERLGDRSASVLGRLVTALFAAFVAALALTNICLVEGSAYGLATDAAPVFWGLVAVAAVAALILPHVGALIAVIMLAAALLANGCYALGVCLLLVTGAWWWFVGRTDKVQAPVALSGPVFGAFGFAAVAPIAAGCLMPVGKAVITAAYSVLLAFVFAGFGTGDIMGWNLFVNSDIANVDVTSVALAALAKTSNWCVAASWILAAAAYSLFCVRGSKAFDVAGAVFAAALLIAGAVVAAGVSPGSNLWLPTVPALLGSLLPGVAGIAAAAMGVADRARWEDEDLGGEDERSESEEPVR